ncbi:MAG: Asp-tRNA(Asn)/Glu-tRNA(Gln) amidotransferase subunit GatA [Gammaproteobacteria bacterium]|nr:MAG: Asp-tRNA(Asn)/Glu-tRNA(Gln) amidotransferase subunit GatA [Gammaproteobacteria bacterium]
MQRPTVAGLSRLLRKREASSRELVQQCLQEIERHNGDLNAFITVTAEQALTAADAADALLARGEGGPLTGIPFAHKDIFCTRGVRTTCGSKMLEHFVAPYDATVVERMAAAGLVMVGKTNMDEFAMGSSNETSFFGPVRNPWDPERSPGGSSGGSAAAVAAGLVPAATGTDTGGSIRQPAAMTGITGFKPTYGRVSRYGMIAFASSLDQAGIFAASAEDAALLLEVMAGFDPRDSTSADLPVPAYSQEIGASLKGRRIGVPPEFFDAGLDAECGARVREALGVFEQLGAKIVEVSLPHLGLSIPTYYIVAPAECSSNLARFDGVRFGHRAAGVGSLEELYKRTRQEGFGAEVKRRIMTGTYVLSAGYYDAYYLQAQKARRLIAEDFRQAFAAADIIAGPTAPTAAFRLGEKTADPVQMYLNDIYTIAVNLAGLPGISIPCGYAQDLPVGLQLIGPAFGEAAVLNFAHQYQTAADWHRHRIARSGADGLPRMIDVTGSTGRSFSVVGTEMPTGKPRR